MIKKISAVVLALVLCLSVVVVPASALDLGSAEIAFELKWDKEYYSAGDTATLNVFMKVQDETELATGSILIAFNSNQLAENSTDTTEPWNNVVASDLYNSFWKEPVSKSQVWWLAEAVVTKVKALNTTEENELYDQYLKLTIARNTGGSHDNAANNKQGLPGADINALADAGEPLVSFTFTVADGVTDGTKLNAAITTGSRTSNPAQTAFKEIANPGTATTTANIAAASIDVSAAVAEATVGTPSIISALNPQIRFNGLETNGAGSANFDVRTRATVSKADFAEVLGVSEAELEATAKASTDLRVGFVYMATSNGEFNIETAKAAAQNPAAAAENYFVKDVTYVQRSGDNYVWTCLLTYEDGMYSNGVSALPYIICGEEVHFLDAVTPVTFSTLYGTYYSQYAATQA